jgi:hypothetical protein
MRGGLVCLTGPHLSDTLTLPIIPRYQSANIARKSTYNRLPVAAGCPASVSTMPSAICMPPSPTHWAHSGARWAGISACITLFMYSKINNIINTKINIVKMNSERTRCY